jgi:hypothetical protein
MGQTTTRGVEAFEAFFATDKVPLALDGRVTGTTGRIFDRVGGMTEGG